MKMLNDHVLLKEAAKEDTVGGIYLPNQKETGGAVFMEVVGVSTGSKIKKGCKVLVLKELTLEVKLEAIKYRVCKEEVLIGLDK